MDAPLSLLSRRLAGLASLLLLAACATPPAPPAPPPAPPPPLAAPSVPTLTDAELEALQRQRLRELTASVHAEPPLTMAASCRFRDEMGYRGQLRMKVRESRVQQLDADVTIPKHGSCHFRLADFEQTETAPSILLAARGDVCQVHVWSRDKEATVAFRGCAAQCSNGSHEYLWPIIVQTDKNTCF